MKPLPPAVRRFLQLALVALATQPAVATLVSSAAVRWPLVGAVIAAVDAGIVALRPTEVTSEKAPPPGTSAGAS